MADANTHINNHDLIVPALQQDLVPGPLIVSGSAVGVWNAVIEAAQCRIQSNSSVAPVPFQTTVEDKCWVTLMALRREEELLESMRYLESAWQELREVKKLLGIEN